MTLRKQLPKPLFELLDLLKIAILGFIVVKELVDPLCATCSVRGEPSDKCFEYRSGIYEIRVSVDSPISGRGSTYSSSR